MNKLDNLKKHLNKTKPQTVIQPMNQAMNNPLNQAMYQSMNQTIIKQLERFNTTCFFEN